MIKLNGLLALHLLAVIPMVLIVLLAHQPASVQADRLGIGKAMGIINWNSYTELYNKRYSSLSQTIARQKIFMANAMNVFITAVKYKLFQLSYYTAINKFSDLTQSESEQMLNGDLQPDREPMEDEEAKKLLLELIGDENLNAHQVEQEIENKRKAALHQSEGGRRRKREANEDKPVEQSSQRKLQLSDLSRPVQDEQWPIENIRWVVPSNNPDYQPVEVTSFGSEITRKVETMQDIPESELAKINVDGGKASNIAGAVKSALRGALDWLSSGLDGDEESEFSSGGMTADMEDTDDYWPKEVIVLKDWRESNCIGPVRSQGQCASCYAMAVMGHAEWAWCKDQGGTLTPLSVQYMVSCGPQMNLESDGKINLLGCSRGATAQGMDFIREYGLELEAHMPYLKEDSECPIEMHSPRKSKGYIRPNVKAPILLNRKTKQLDLALKAGPLIMSMRFPDGMLNFGGGMIEHCKENGRHAVLLVGNAIEDGVEYLILRNSFGTDWGDQGYFKLKRSAIPECVREFMVPQVNFPSNKSQSRRIKSYLANRSPSSLQPAVESQPSLENLFQ